MEANDFTGYYLAFALGFFLCLCLMALHFKVTKDHKDDKKEMLLTEVYILLSEWNAERLLGKDKKP